MKAAGYTYAQPNAKRAIEAVTEHIERQEGALAAIDGTSKELEAVAGEAAGLAERIECAAGVSADCAGTVPTRSAAEPLLRLGAELRARFDAIPTAEPPMNTLDLSRIPQP
jgi:hypothetical protein